MMLQFPLGNTALFADTEILEGVIIEESHTI